jgi:hypothetical protein
MSERQNWRGYGDKKATEQINHPAHYNSNPSGVECITVAQHLNFCMGNAMKYVWRAGFKVGSDQDAEGAKATDIKKAIWYLQQELARLGAT